MIRKTTTPEEFSALLLKTYQMNCNPARGFTAPCNNISASDWDNILKALKKKLHKD